MAGDIRSILDRLSPPLNPPLEFRATQRLSNKELAAKMVGSGRPMSSGTNATGVVPDAQPDPVSLMDVLDRLSPPPKLEGAEFAGEVVRAGLRGLGAGAEYVASGVDIAVRTGIEKALGIDMPRAKPATGEFARAMESIGPDAPAKRYTPSLTARAAEALGSTMPMVAAGVAGGPAALVGVSVLQSGAQAYSEALAGGLSEDVALKSFVKGLPVGALELFGPEMRFLKALEKAGKAVGGVAKGVAKGVATNVPQELAQEAGAMWANGLDESGGEILDRLQQTVGPSSLLGAFFGGAAGALRARGAVPAPDRGDVKAAPMTADEAFQKGAKKVFGDPFAQDPQLAGKVNTPGPLSPGTALAMASAGAQPHVQGKPMPAAQDLAEFEPQAPEHVFAQEWMANRGMRAIFVGSRDGKPLPFRGMTLGDAVYFDANADPVDIKRHVVYHEGVHSLDAPVRNELIGAIRAVDPKGFAAIETSLRARYPADVVGEEVAAHNAEFLTDWITEAHSNPQRIQAIIEHNPGLWVRFVDALKKAAQKMGLNVQTSLDKLVGDLEGDPKARAEAANLYVQAFDTMLGREVKFDTAGMQEALAGAAATPVATNQPVASEQASAVTQGPEPVPSFALTPDATGTKSFHAAVPAEGLLDKLVKFGSDRFRRTRKVESSYGEDAISRAETTMRGYMVQDARHVKSTYLEPVAQIARERSIPLEYSGIGGDGKVSLADWARYLAAPQRNIALKGNTASDLATGRVGANKLKFGIESDPASGRDSLGAPITNSYALAQQQRVLSGPDADAYRQIAEHLRAANEWKIARLVESGLQSERWRDGYRDPETGKIVERGVVDKYGPYYSSFANDPDDVAYGGTRTVAVSGSQYQQAKGRLDKGGNAWLLMINDLANTIQRSRRNEVGRLVGDFVGRHQELGNVLPGQKETNALYMELVSSPSPQRKAEILTRLRKPTVDERKRGQVFTYREKGEDIDILLNDPLLAESLKGLDPEQLHGVLRFIAPFTRYYRSMVTQLNPFFSLRNAPRDAGFAWSSLFLKHGVRTANGAIKRLFTGKPLLAMAQMETGKPATDATRLYRHYAEEAFANGADVTRVDWRDIDSAFRSLSDSSLTERAAGWLEANTPKEFEQLGEALTSINSAVEGATRLAVYVELRERGHSVADAVKAYRETTVDWARQGTASNWLGSLLPFAPAGLKGAHQFAHTIRTAPRKRLTALAASFFAAGYFASYVSRAMSDEWDDESAFSKSRRFMLKYGKWSVGISAPWGFNLFYYAGVLAADVIHGDTSPAEATANLASAAAEVIDPFGFPSISDIGERGPMNVLKSTAIGLTPAIVRPLFEVGFNRTFTGGPTHPDSEYLKPHKQAWSTTGGAFVAFAEWLNRMGGGGEHRASPLSFSPAALEHIVRGYVPGIGTEIVRAIDVGEKILSGDAQGLSPNEVPGLNAYVRETPRGAVSQKYAAVRQMVDDAMDAVKDHDASPEERQLAGYQRTLNRVDLAISDMVDQRDAATDPNHKRAIDDRIRYAKKYLTERVKAAAKKPQEVK